MNIIFLSEHGLQTITDHGAYRHTGGTTGGPDPEVFQKGRRVCITYFPINVTPIS